MNKVPGRPGLNGKVSNPY